jgi:hypothetical protein
MLPGLVRTSKKISSRLHASDGYAYAMPTGRDEALVVARLEGAEHLGVATRVRVGGIGRLGSLRLLKGTSASFASRLPGKFNK